MKQLKNSKILSLGLNELTKKENIMNIKYVLGVFLSCLLASTSVSAKPASKESVKILMERTGAGNLGVQMIDQLIPSLQQAIPQAPEKFWADMRTEIDANQIVELVIPVYQKHLTEEDVKEINAFYDSPVGKKLIKAQPEIIQDSFKIGQEWGKKVALDVIEKYKEQSKKTK